MKKTKKTKTNVDDGPEVNNKPTKATIENDPNEASTANGPHVAPGTATNEAANKSQSRKEKNAALKRSKDEDEKILMYYAEEKNITVQGKTKNAIRAEVLNACDCTTLSELRQIYAIRFNKEPIMSDVTNISSL
jgi:hypothetical protein